MSKRKHEKPKKERVKGAIPYALGNICGLASYTIMAQLTFALTDSFGMAVGTVGLILLVSRCLDGITDIIAGFIIDHTNTRWGKARPYDLMFIPLWICTILCFSVPTSLGNVGKIIWVFVTYNLCQSVVYTFCTCIETVRLKRSFTENNHIRVITISQIITYLSSLVVGILMPQLISLWGDKPHGWTLITAVFTVPYLICGMLRFFLLKELDSDSDVTLSSDKIPLKQAVSALFKNPYAFIVGGMALLLGIDATLSASTVTYYFKYIFGDVGMGSVIYMFTLLVLVFLAFLPRITTKLRTKNTLLLGFALLTIGGLLKYIMPVNVLWLGMCVVISTSGTMFANSVRALALTEAMTYGEWQSGVNFEAIYASVSGMCTKIGMGLASVLLGFFLSRGGYDGTLSVQTESALKAIQFTYCGLPAVIGILGILLTLTYTLDKKLPNIRKELAARTASSSEKSTVS